MTQEEKQLLLKVLCEMLPYTPILNILGVAGYDEKLIAINRAFTHSNYTIITNSLEEYPRNSHGFDIEEVRPYLRPMSGMTEEENEYRKELIKDIKHGANIDKLEDFYHSRNLDYRDLIGKGLALEAPEGMYQ